MRLSGILISALLLAAPAALPGSAAAGPPGCDRDDLAGAPYCEFLRGLQSVLSGGMLASSTDSFVPPPSRRDALASEATIRASRIFAGPTQYPPAEFAAYGILAFPSRATSADRARHVMICEAYVATLPAVAELVSPRAEQMVTVWPVQTDAEGARLTADPPVDLCGEAVTDYSLLQGLRAIRLAEQAGAGLGEGRGPYLLAWSPGERHGARDAHMLRMDMSQVSSHEQALRFFRRWVDDIEQNPELWQQGWNLETLRLLLQAWADDMGERILSF
ncbi:hypothetical protein [Paracoccus sp. (in: a-proteobacteria)]|uniref:hypothetical protein n=1 Tax=Paracoccus sp. TaxID=267 RepID=UPI00321F7393